MLICCLLAVAYTPALNGATDPDLFDGRYLDNPKSTSAASNGIDESNKDDGDSIENGNGKAADNKKLSAEEASGEVKEANGKVSDSETLGDGASSVGKTPSSNDVIRSFDEFEIGVTDATNAQIEIKRSTELGEPTVSPSQSSRQATDKDLKNTAENSQESSTGDQETFDGSGSADFGNDVPFGL